ncbi:MAG: sigma 54-interacting transcriptional regulator, partial [Candidatus Sulfotelmatobacter sp.]
MASNLAVFQPDDPSPFPLPENPSQPEKLLTAYFNSANVGLCILDTEFHYVAINQKLAAMNSLPIAAHLGKTLREIIGDLAGPIESTIRQVLSSKQPMDHEVSGKVPAKDEIGHWMVHYVPLADESGNVTRIGVLVVEITVQKELEKSLRRESARLQMLMEVSTLLSSNWSFDQVFPQISARIRRVLRHEFASFNMHDPATGLLIRQALDFPLGKGITQAVPIAVSTSPAGAALKQRETMIFSQKQLETFDSAISRSYVAEGLKSLCCVPLLRPKNPVGVLVLGSTRKHAFHSDDLHLLNQIAAQLGIAIENQRAAAEIHTLKSRLSEEKKYLEGEIRADSNFSELVGDSAALTQVLGQVSTVATSDATVLILGETGTGKELVARAVHELSARRKGSFVKVNCAA